MSTRPIHVQLPALRTCGDMSLGSGWGSSWVWCTPSLSVILPGPLGLSHAAHISKPPALHPAPHSRRSPHTGQLGPAPLHFLTMVGKQRAEVWSSRLCLQTACVLGAELTRSQGLFPLQSSTSISSGDNASNIHNHHTYAVIATATTTPVILVTVADGCLGSDTDWFHKCCPVLASYGPMGGRN